MPRTVIDVCDGLDLCEQDGRYFWRTEDGRESCSFDNAGDAKIARATGWLVWDAA